MYRQPFTTDPSEEYPVEPTDAQCNVLVRALAHWVEAYAEPDVTAREIVQEILELNPLSTEPLSADELLALSRPFGIVLGGRQEAVQGREGGSS